MPRSLSRFWLWRLPAAAGLLLAVFFATGFWLALRGSLGDPIGSAPPPPAGPAPAKTVSGAPRFLLVLGDSLARGTGDETGKGFAGDLAETLRRRGPVTVANLAVNGWESSDVRGLLESTNARALAARADWIVLSAGGNDLSHAVPRGQGTPAQVLGSVGESKTRFAANLRQILTSLRESNSRAPIYVLGLYNPFNEKSPAARAGASVLLSWNSVIEETALSFPDVFVVPTFDLFAARADRLAVDHFHPNGKGHQAIAERIAQVLPPDARP